MGDVKVLLLDDDQSFLSGMKASLSALGYEVYATHSTEDAKGLIQYNDIKCWIIDCLLPGESGIDFSKTLINHLGLNPDCLILMSGLFTDPSFTKDAVLETGAKDFLLKPIDVKKLVKILPQPTKGAVLEEAPEQRKRLYEIFGSVKREPRYLRKLFESIEVIHGFDLPLIYSLLMESHLSGFLNLTSEDGKIFGVSFSEGEIVGVDLDDKETFLGKLLIEHGFLLSGDLEAVLSQTKTRRLGETLVKEYVISPHALDMAMSEQMGIRLSRTILDQKVKFNFSESPVDRWNPSVDKKLFNTYLHDWVNSKLSLYWLRAQLSEWRYSLVKKTGSYDEILNQIENFPLFSVYPHMPSDFAGQPLLQDLFTKHKQNEEEFLKMTYILLAKGAIFFEEKDLSEAHSKVTGLKELWNHLQSLNASDGVKFLAEFIGSTTDNREVLKMAILSYLSPFEKTKNGVLKAQVDQIKAHVYKILEQDFGKQKLSQDKANVSLEAMRLLEEGRSFLQKGQILEALKFLQESLDAYPKLPKQKLYWLWAKIQSKSSWIEKAEIKELETVLLKVDPEDKHEALYHFVHGLVLKIKGQKDTAMRSFEKALALDSQFIHARREMMVLKSQSTEKKGNVLDADLKTLMTNLFSKKKSS
jgi:FixJ family two-component response regulator/tetratricopeptide (TPR) repeat protein